MVLFKVCQKINKLQMKKINNTVHLLTKNCFELYLYNMGLHINTNDYRKLIIIYRIHIVVNFPRFCAGSICIIGLSELEYIV